MTVKTMNSVVLDLVKKHWPEGRNVPVDKQKEANRKIARGIMAEFGGVSQSVHDNIPSEILWAKKVLGLK